MQKLSSHTKLGLGAFTAISLLGFSLSSASYNVKLATVNEYYDANAGVSKMSAVHFKENGNDFGGFLYISKLEALGEGNETSITLGGEEYICKNEVRGYYYDSQRGERLWPLDAATARLFNDSSLGFSGGLYTTCRNVLTYNNELAYCNSCSESDNGDNDACSNSAFTHSSGYDVGDYFGDDPKKVFLSDCVDYVEKEFTDDKGIYGSIQHSYKGQDYYLLAGVKYENNEPWIKVKSSLATTFQRFLYGSNNATHPVGLIYDKNGGVGFVGCEIRAGNIGDIVDEIGSGDVIAHFTGNVNSGIVYNSTKVSLECNNIGSAGSSLLGLIIDGLVGMGSDVRLDQLDTVNGSKTQYFSSVNINNASFINYAKVAAESLCRGQWNGGEHNNIVCIDDDINVNAGDYRGKTLIVKNGDVTVSPAVTSDSDKYDIFVDGGDLIIDDSKGDSFVFNKNGFISTMSTGDFNMNVENAASFTGQTACERGGKNIRKSFGGEGGVCLYGGDEVSVAKLLRGNFMVNGHIKFEGEESTENKYFIQGKLSTLDSYDELKATFAWMCNDGEGADGNKCPSGEYHNYQNAPLVVVDQNYDSPLFW